MRKKVPRRPRLTVWLLSAHPLVLKEFSDLLTPHGFQVETHQLESGPNSIGRLLRVPEAQVYVVDGLGSAAGTDVLLISLRDHYPNARVLTIAEEFDESNAFPLLLVGAKGLLSYAQARNRLAEAVRAVAAGGFWVQRSLLSRFVDSILPTVDKRHVLHEGVRISRREREVLKALLENLSNKEIGVRLHVSDRTVKFHISNLLRKFGVRRRGDLILLHFQRQQNPLP